MGSNLEHAIADTLSRLGPMPITDLVNALSLMGTPGCSLKNVKSTLKSNSSLFGEGEGGWSCLKPYDSTKAKSEKKRAGDPTTLPEASKKAKTGPTQLFQTKMQWSSTSTTKTQAPTSTTSQSAANPSASKSAPSAPLAPPTSTSTQNPAQPARKGAFGFQPRSADSESTRKPTVTSRKPSEPQTATVSAAAPILPLPTVESTLPTRFVAEGMSIDKALEKVVGARSSTSTDTKPLIIMDSANVSHEHGAGMFSTKGLPIAVEYFRSKGFRVVAFLPEHYLTQHYPDPLQDWSELEALVKKKILVPTPDADYDDLYIVQHARQHNGVIVTRDKYRDVPLSFTDPKERAEVAKWIKSHRIPFKFDGDTFVPFSVPKGFPLQL